MHARPDDLALNHSLACAGLLLRQPELPPVVSTGRQGALCCSCTKSVRSRTPASHSGPMRGPSGEMARVCNPSQATRRWLIFHWPSRFVRMSTARQLQRHELAGARQRRGDSAARLSTPRVNHVGIQAMGQRHLGYRGAGLAAFGQHFRLELRGIRAHSGALGGLARVHSNPLVDTTLAAAS